MNEIDLGFGFKSFKKIGRIAKKVGKGAYKYSGTGLVVKGNIALAKLSAQLMLLPLKYLKKAVVMIGRVLCKAPRPLLEKVAEANGINPAFIPLFCQVVKTDSWSLSAIRKYLPTALKLAIKLGATGAFPPIVPVLVVVKRIPGLSRFAGADDLGSYHSDLRKPELRAGIDAMELYALSDYLGLMGESDVAALGIDDADRVVMQGYLQGALGESSDPPLGGVADPAFAQALLMSLAAGATGLGAILTLRE